jgi:glycosyltransferase involved in cell wall biosynthesis
LSEADWVSVVIPTYNRGHLIERTIKSVFAQTYDRWDIIVVDDGSEDNTAEVVSRLSDRVTYIRRGHSGLPAVARNAGIRSARGEYIAFLDSDDLWIPEKLEIQVNALKQHPIAGIACADAYVKDECQQQNGGNRTIWDGNIPPSGAVFRSLFQRNFVHTSTAMVRRECFDTVGYFDESTIYRAVEDYHLWLRIAAKYEVVSLQQTLIYYSHHKGRISDENKEQTNESLTAVLIDIYHNDGGLFREIEKEAARRIGDAYENIGYPAFKQGKMISAWRAFEEAARWRKSLVQMPLLRGLIAFALMGTRILLEKVTKH